MDSFLIANHGPKFMDRFRRQGTIRRDKIMLELAYRLSCLGQEYREIGAVTLTCLTFFSRSRASSRGSNVQTVIADQHACVIGRSVSNRLVGRQRRIESCAAQLFQGFPDHRHAGRTTGCQHGIDVCPTSLLFFEELLVMSSVFCTSGCATISN